MATSLSKLSVGLLHCGILLLAGCMSANCAWADAASGIDDIKSSDDDANDPDKDNSFLCISEQAIYHSNLYHLNRNITDIQQLLGPGTSRQNTVLSTSACGEDHWHLKQQDFSLKGAINDNRFLDNEFLNHVSGNGELIWDWRAAAGWHGQLGGNYQRALGTFLNDRPIVKDLVDSSHYFAEINRDFGAHVMMRVRGIRTDTSHDAVPRQVDNYRSDNVLAELILMSTAENYIGFGVQHTRAAYPFVTMIGDLALDRNYNEDTESFRFHYQIEPKTILEGSAGYLDHEYPHDPDSNYAGEVWRLTLHWLPTSNIQLVMAGWKDLSSYFDSESDHFISRGASFSPNWTPDDKWNFSFPLRWERQQYISRSILTATLQGREDVVKMGGMVLAYRPHSYLDVDLSYSYEQHTSNIEVYGYLDQVTALQLRFRFL